jgi:hypothetical protein
MIAWDIPVGWTGTRDEIAAMFGGSKYGGMETPTATPNVLLFSDPKVGRANGYEFDGWSAAGDIFSYTGMDQVGPQKMHKGNRALRDHKLNGKAVRLFGVSGKAPSGSGLTRIYLGEFEIDDEIPFSIEDAPGADDVMRTVFVFHLRPVGEVLRRDEDVSSVSAPLTDSGSATEVPLENHTVEEFQRPAVEAGTGVKREQDLVNAFQEVLIGRGRTLTRFKVYPKGSTMPLFTDIHDQTEGILYEAKADATRNSVRAGLGQLLDYRRYVGDRPCRLLLPAKPNDDLLELLGDHDIDVVWRADNGRAFHIYASGQTAAF